MRNDPRPQEIYQHFKGNLYQIITLAEHSETGEIMVIYQALYGNFRTYARPLIMFMEKTDKAKFPDVLQEYRFELQNNKKNSEATKTNTLHTASIQEETKWKNTQPGNAQAEIQTKDTQTENMQTGVQREDTLKESVRSANSLGEPAQTMAVPGEAQRRFYVTEPQGQEEEESDLGPPEVDPKLMKFLGAANCEERLQILTGLRHRITDSMINTMAVSLDLEIADGDPEERYEELRRCLLTMKRFEINR